MIPTPDVNVDNDAADLSTPLRLAETSQQPQQVANPIIGAREQEAEGEAVKVRGEGEEVMASWAGQPSIKGSSESMRMALLTVSLIGLQFVPYLLPLLSTHTDCGIAGSLGGLK